MIIYSREKPTGNYEKTLYGERKFWHFKTSWAQKLWMYLASSLVNSPDILHFVHLFTWHTMCCAHWKSHQQQVKICPLILPHISYKHTCKHTLKGKKEYLLKYKLICIDFLFPQCRIMLHFTPRLLELFTGAHVHIVRLLSSLFHVQAS